MIRLTLLLALAATLAQAVYADCDLNGNTLGARYEVSHKDEDGNTSRSHFILWRDENRVAHQHVESGVLNVWIRTERKDLYLTRYFDDYKRGIEYQPGDLRGETTETMWQRTRALLAPGDVEKLPRTDTFDHDCDHVEQHQLTAGGDSVTVQWRPELELLQSLSRSHDGEQNNWELVEIIKNPQQVAAAFKGRNDYDLVDYADIGDNESDPFLAKMIHLGFTGPSHLVPGNSSAAHSGHQH